MTVLTIMLPRLIRVVGVADLVDEFLPDAARARSVSTRLWGFRFHHGMGSMVPSGSVSGAVTMLSTAGLIEGVPAPAAAASTTGYARAPGPR